MTPRRPSTNDAGLRIAFIVPYLFRFQRGIERSCVHLANELLRMGHEVTLLAWDRPQVETDFQFHPQLRIFRVPYFRYYQSRWAIPFYAYELLRRPYDVINVYFAGYGEAEAVSLARRLRRFQINFIVGYPFDLVPHRYREFRRFRFDSLLDNVFVRSSSLVPGASGFFEREVHVVPNGVDTSFFYPDQEIGDHLRKEYEIDKGEYILLTVSALEKRKGVQYVIRALPELLESGLPIRYFVVGDGPIREELEALAHRLHVEDDVYFSGTVTEVQPFYQAADVFLLLSESEAFGNVILEAWASALPVVTSDEPPFPSFVPEGKGLMVNKDNVNEVKNTIRTLLQDAEKRVELGNYGRAYVEANYAWSEIARRYIDVFRLGTGQNL